MRLLRSELGSGTVLVVGLLAAAVLLTTTVHSLSVTVLARARASAAADAAALAAADSASGREPGLPCDNAERLAVLHVATVTACVLDGLVATVAVAVSAPFVTVSARATAGPP